MNEKQMAELLSRITHNPGIFGGKAIIRGMRFRVVDVLELLGSGMTSQEILQDFPYLEEEDIQASLLFAAQRVDATAHAA